MKDDDIDEEEEEFDEERAQTIRVELFKKAGVENAFIFDFQKEDADFFTFNKFFGDIYKAHYEVNFAQ